MSFPKIAILGAGISGLSAAWFLKKAHPAASITILEKTARCGGVINRSEKENFSFELGPKTFAAARSKELLQLIEELQLESKLIKSNPNSNKRYIYYNKELHLVPKNLWKCLTSPLTRPALIHLIKEVFIPPSHLDEDETIGEFCRRRFGSYITDVLVNPLVLGIYAADSEHLSVEACFGFLKEAEKRSGSILKDMLKKKKNTKASSGLLNLQGGLQTLVETLESTFEKEIHYNETVVEVKPQSSGYEVITDQGSYIVDAVVSALNLHALRHVKLPFEKAFKETLKQGNSSSIVSVNLGYEGKDVIPNKGFGYLIPSCENEPILGAVFDSLIFDDEQDQTRMTVMLGHSYADTFSKEQEKEAIEIAKRALKRHLKINQEPCMQQVIHYSQAIPKYPLNHQRQINKLLEVIKKEHPQFYLTGAYIKGASINACIGVSQKVAQEMVFG